MAYFSEKAHCAFSSKTLMLQVRFAHPPNPAPSYRFFVLFRSAYFPSPHRIGFSSRSGVPHGLFFRKSTLCFFFQNAHASGSLRSPSEPRTVLSFLCTFLQNARPPGSLRSPSEPRTVLSFLCTFLQNARPPGSLRSPSVCAPKPSFRRFRCSAWLILRFRTIAHTGAGVSLGLFGKPKRSSFSCIRSLHQSTLRCLL